MATQTLFEGSDHRNLLLEDFGTGKMVQANQHLIIDHGRAMLLDPGGHKVYSSVLAEVSSILPLSALDYLFFSHQDPDIIAAANGWFMVTESRAFLSQLWLRFLMHFGVDDLEEERIILLGDKGAKIELGGCTLLALPGHFMHSSGNFHIYDPVAKILYTGDLGASMGQPYRIVEDFDKHIQYMEGFHRRYIPSGRVLQFWARMVSELDIETIAPQHGAIMPGRENVERFIAWVSGLKCGLDLMESYYQVPK